MGRLIPAGSGVTKYSGMEAVTDEPEGAEEATPGATPEAVG